MVVNMRIKIFESDYDMESKINNWILENENTKTVIDMRFVPKGNSYDCIIVYEEKIQGR